MAPCATPRALVYYPFIMNKILSIVSAAVCAASLSAFAQEAEEAELETSEEKIWTAGFDADFLTGYQWRNAISNNEGAFHGCFWGDVDVFGPLSVGGYVWQNYDFTNNRRDSYRNALTETDYGIHMGLNAWASEEEEYSLDFELGHEWYTYHNRVHGTRKENPDTREIYLKATFENPAITPYGQISWMYDDLGDYDAGIHYEIGFTKEVPVTEEFSVGADWNVNFANRDYQAFLLGTTSSGLFGTTVKVFGKYAFTEWMSMTGTLAYTGLLNRDARDEIADDEEWDYDRDFLWGGLSLNLEF